MHFQDICGLEYAKRALEVAIAGGHSILFIGPWTSQAGDLVHLAREYELTARHVAPCPCGFYGHPVKQCTCSIEQVNRWQARNPGNRAQFDIYVEVEECQDYQIMAYLAGKHGETDVAINTRIGSCSRYTDMSLDEPSTSILRAAIKHLSLSFSQVRNVLYVARTIANLAGSPTIQTAHLAEAIQYRPRRKY